jgi:hypothetical protein
MSFKLRLLGAVAFVFLCACHSKDRIHVETDEGPPRMAAMLTMADEKTAPQLLEGFYGLEDKSWRWTAGHFSVLLGTPPRASQDGAVLKVQLSIPKPLIDRVKTTSLTAEIGGARLSPESFTQPGAFTFVRDVPAKALEEDSVRVDFSLDRFLPAGTVDGRELGLVVTSVGFEPQKSKSAAP